MHTRGRLRMPEERGSFSGFDLTGQRTRVLDYGRPYREGPIFPQWIHRRLTRGELDVVLGGAVG